MKINNRQLNRIINEEISSLLEYEQYVDEDGNVWDDEGNVTRRGSGFGRRYGGQTYTGTRPPWSRREDRFKRRRASSGQIEEPRNSRINAIKSSLEIKDDKFLRSILSQLEAGRRLSEKQKKIVRKIIIKTTNDAGLAGADEAAALFENRFELREKKMRITKRQLRRIIREEARRLHEDTIDHELDNLKKNIGDDIEHIRDLKDDIKDDHDEELRAEKEKERKDESISRRRLRNKIRRLMREERDADWGMGHDEDSRTRPGEKDYTGHEGDLSKTHAGRDYEGDHEDDVHHKAKAAVAAIQDLASAAGVDIEMEVDDEDLEPGEESEEEVEEMGLPMESRIRRRRMIRKIVRENTRRPRKNTRKNIRRRRR